MEDSLQFDYVFKFILVGDAAVGKTTILSQFISSSFQSEHNPTMGVEFAMKKINCDGQLIKTQVWDTAGQQSFRTITRAYYKNAIGIILVYDVSAPSSFEAINSWLKQIQDNSNEMAQIVIVANKIDLVPNFETPNQSHYEVYPVSAKTGHNVQKLFKKLAEKVLSKINKGLIVADGTYGVKKGNVKNPTFLKKDQLIVSRRKKCC